ncbi:MAG: hypothetical protein AAF362_20970, partial [Pseudomonadota bacterium]
AGQLWDSFEQPAKELAEKAGGEFHELTGPELEEMKAAGDKLIEKWIADADEKGLEGEMLVEKARELIAKYE